ncbi:acyl-CoA dehydrogenase [Burkholderia sp. WAC0059]|uniref:acyl-CoA dehydrogenase family protein n=1 Tax=Burkholderia sp. WAC0059 TaxID=2066022 RepID=UPI000C7F04F0|nr:acyl-CoA dehydrogenase family protein [Burkholderia sp. WAC0059]PLZ02535.1 acyl-CoA dehydrogenase [Burkholderia sp. WAC0059]
MTATASPRTHAASYHADVPDVADAASLFGDNELVRRFAPVFERIAAGAVERERKRELAREAVQWLREAGFTRLRVPKQYGGEGVGIADYFALVVRLGEADSNLPQILRVHGGFVEALIESDDETLREAWFSRIARGEIVGGAVAERTAVTSNSVRVTHGDGTVRLDGEKYYTTGSIYADWIDVAAHDGQTDVRILVQAGTPGLELVDDWDGFGQRLTGSGTTRFHGVVVPAGQLYRRFDASAPRRNTLLTPYYQIVHLANLAGITRAVLRDAVDFTRTKTRTFGVPGESSPRENPLVQRVIGRLASLAYSTEAVVSTLARALDEISAARAAGRADTGAYVRLDIQAFEAQQIVIEQALQASTLLFEIGGASATSETRRFDRYWRNARVLASHNPATLREAVIGNFYLNGEGHDERFNVVPSGTARAA